MPVCSMAMNAPPKPARPPLTITARNFIRYTFTPRLSAPTGCSPDALIRKPIGVRHRRNTERGTRARATTVAHETLRVIPESRAAASDTSSQLRSSIHPNRSGVVQPNRSPPDTKGTLSSPTDSTRGDWVRPPPDLLTKNSRDRKRVRAGAMMLTATPEMMWSTPKLTVATAWMRPPPAPPAIPMAMPHHGPNSSAPQAPNHVPSTIIPSRPMLTTPARSAQMPPRPASRMGTARRSVDSAVPAEMRSVVSGRASSWMIDRTTTSPRAATIQRNTIDERRRPFTTGSRRWWPTSGSPRRRHGPLRHDGSG